MPFGDRRGPEGRGPMTGRGNGLCSGNRTGGYVDHDYPRGRGRGYGRGVGASFRGSGRGRGRDFYYRYDVTHNEYADYDSMADEISKLRNRLEELEKKSEDSSNIPE
ncbi:MAG: DUF5320 domain-containing protein [Deltaproteobacteria bacterium]|nr:DUF5320 domain-containing protein [Deltaproteobacteria bacterium]